VKPGQQTYFGVPSEKLGFDYDCDQRFTRDPALDVSLDCRLDLAACDTARQGFLGPVPECGASASWGACRRELATCVNDPRSMQVMKCR
jgi:hypothetical protein